MPTSTLRALTTTTAYTRRKSPRIAFHSRLKHVLQRRAASGANRDYLLQKDDIGIRLADRREQIDQVGMLVTRMYRRRGYLVPVSARPEDSIRQVTLEACYRNQTVGTLTVNLDSAEGLRAEELYAGEIGKVRGSGARVCEFTRLALDAEECSMRALACLFHLGFIFAYRIHQASDLFIEVNPRHALFYRRKLGFVQSGEEKVCPRVNAPAVLLHKKLPVLADEIVRFGGRSGSNCNSFYALGLSMAEESELVQTIRMALADPCAEDDEAELEGATAGLARSA